MKEWTEEEIRALIISELVDLGMHHGAIESVSVTFRTRPQDKATESEESEATPGEQEPHHPLEG